MAILSRADLAHVECDHPDHCMGGAVVSCADYLVDL